MRFKVTWSKPKNFKERSFDLSVEGVYLIGYRDARTNTRYIVWLGQGDVGSRLVDHYRNNSSVRKRLNQVGRVGYYRYAQVEEEDDRLDIELGLYHNHGGSNFRNVIEPAGSGRYAKVEVQELFL
jgi:hypothetical protein